MSLDNNQTFYLLLIIKKEAISLMGLYDVDVVARGDGDAAAKLMHYCPRLSPSVAI